MYLVTVTNYSRTASEVVNRPELEAINHFVTQRQVDEMPLFARDRPDPCDHKSSNDAGSARTEDFVTRIARRLRRRAGPIRLARSGVPELTNRESQSVPKRVCQV